MSRRSHRSLEDLDEKDYVCVMGVLESRKAFANGYMRSA